MRASGAFPDRAEQVADRLAAMVFPRPFRPYQERALGAFERQRPAGDRRFYLTMPPGSGKTLMGLEIARRLGRPTLVLGPNTAVQAQWLREWAAFEPPLVAADADPSLSSPITVLTYQAIAVLDRSPDEVAASDLDGAPEPQRPRSAQERRQAWLLVARGGDHAAVLGLLHRNGRNIIERLQARGPVTLVLDECHHLLNLWGHVLEAVIAELHPESAVIGLTATPPRDFVAREAALYRRLFGSHADFEVVTPAVVKDGYLGPYQELAYLTRPTPEEQRWIARQQERFDGLLSDLFDPSFATTSFGAWFAVRFIDRRTGDGAPVAWRSIELDDPDLARAALRWVWSRDQRPPPGAAFREEHRREPDTLDWVALLGGFVDDVLRPSTEEYDRIALERIRKGLPSVGFVLTRRGIRPGRPVVDRVMALSAAKAGATARILQIEEQALGRRLRALVLCDFESAGRDVGAALQGVLAEGAGSAASALRVLLADEATAGLNPVLVSGRTVGCSRSTAMALADFARNHPDLHETFDGVKPTAWTSPDRDAALDWGDLVVVDPGHPAWTPRAWVPLVTDFFAAGLSRCLIGTRALLGEGWNAPCANVLIDLGGATTSISVHQVRGRTLRLDPEDPAKVADNWDVVVVAGGHVRGTADYERFVRKHQDYYALSGTGEIESGVSHVDSTLSPFGPPSDDACDALTERLLTRPANREMAREGWRIGEAYRDSAVQTVRIRMGRSPGLPGRRLFRDRAAAEPDGMQGPATTLAALSGVGLVGGLMVGQPMIGGLVGALAGGTSVAVDRARRRVASLAPSDTLEDLAHALAEALAEADLIDGGLRGTVVRVAAQPGGYYRCFLEGARAADAQRFAEALAELIEPIWDPRWIVSRRLRYVPTSPAGAIRLLAGQLRGVVPAGEVVWHTVPTVLTRRRASIETFERAWRLWVSADGRVLPVTDPEAQGVLAARTGDDPFEVETQRRVLWT